MREILPSVKFTSSHPQHNQTPQNHYKRPALMVYFKYKAFRGSDTSRYRPSGN